MPHSADAGVFQHLSLNEIQVNAIDGPADSIRSDPSNQSALGVSSVGATTVTSVYGGFLRRNGNGIHLEQLFSEKTL
jgi:hypothetical protein